MQPVCALFKYSFKALKIISAEERHDPEYTSRFPKKLKSLVCNGLGNLRCGFRRDLHRVHGSKFFISKSRCDKSG
jgi:hypothetical protein